MPQRTAGPSSTSRASLREQGEAMRRRLFGERRRRAGDHADAQHRGELRRDLEPARAGARRPHGLRAGCAGAVQRLPKLRRHVAAALDLGLSARSIVEILIQIGIYAGFAASEEAVEAAAAVFAARGIALPEETDRDDGLEALTARGRKLMEQLHGERATQGYATPGNTVTGALYPLAVQYGYGEIWFRPGLDLRRRALVAVAAFTALKLDSQVRKFGELALNMGLAAPR